MDPVAYAVYYFHMLAEGDRLGVDTADMADFINWKRNW